jgi:hypothetical protein
MSFIEGTRIPKTIYICFKHKRLPPKVVKNWETLNPDYKVFLFDDDDCERFLLEHYGPRFAFVFRSIPDGAIKSDFWRACVLYKMGGVYSDADIHPLRSISQFIRPGIHMLTCHSMWDYRSNSNGPNSLNPHFIISEPGSPILQKCIDTYMRLSSTNTTYNYWNWSITGIMAHALYDIAPADSMSSKPAQLVTKNGLKIQFLHEHGPSGETIVGESPLVGCYNGNQEVLKNRYEDYKHWNTRSEFESRRRDAHNRGIKGVAPLRRVSRAKWSSDSLRQF